MALNATCFSDTANENHVTTGSHISITTSPERTIVRLYKSAFTVVHFQDAIERK